MDKYLDEMTAQDFIQANTTAELDQLEDYKEQLNQHKDLIDEMKMLQAKNQKHYEELQSIEAIIKQNVELLNSKNPSEVDNSALEKVAKDIGKMQEHVHSESVRVYRNVQAVIEEQSRLMQEKAEENKQELVEAINKKPKKNVAVIVLLILTLGVSIAHFVVDLLILNGII